MNRFLIVRLGALGDIVHTLPVAAALRQAYPDAKIDWLVSARHREVLDLVPVVDERIAINDREGARGGLSLLAAVRRMRACRYDAALDLQGLMKSAIVARASGARRVIGFGGHFAREALAKAFYTERYDPGGGGMFDPNETRHVVQLNLLLLKPLGVIAAAPTFPLAPVESAVADAMARETAAGDGSACYALLNPGAAWINKRWPPARFGALAAVIRQRHGLRSVVLWGPGERELGEAAVAHSAGAAIITPPTTIADIVALARRAAVMVSGDTGPTHIAAAVGTPLVGIYGPTRPERNGPWRSDDQTVSRAAVCECHHLRQCRRDRMCLLEIEVEEVLAAVERRLAAGERRA